MSRPWNVDDTLSPIIHAVFLISLTPSMPSRSCTGVISPLSGNTKNCPFFDFTTTALRAEPTPGSITTRNTVPGG